VTFEIALGAFGALLMLGAVLSGVASRGMLSLILVFLVGGFVLGPGVSGALRLHATSGFVSDLTVAALIVILFRDGLEVESEMLRAHWRLPARKLAIGLPITAGIVALVTRLAVGLPWLQSCLVGVLLAPTDPMLSSGVVSDPRVPAVVRHSLNLESGFNDGLALPAVLALVDALETTSHGFVWWRFALQDIGVGVLFGLLCGLFASTVMPRARGASIEPHQVAVFGLGVALATFSATVLPPHGNGLIAVYTCAIVLGSRRPDLPEAMIEGTSALAEMVKVGVFGVFGSLLTLNGLSTMGWGAVAVVLGALVLARPVAVWIALAGTQLGSSTKAFMAWFGPKGAATITFSLLVSGRAIPHASEIFDITALAVVASAVAHGLTETSGIRHIAGTGGLRTDAELRGVPARIEHGRDRAAPRVARTSSQAPSET
jgi:NhaP-type Na+/H+ or K+/H+ antiporter